jgi:hypothetical protein
MRVDHVFLDGALQDTNKCATIRAFDVGLVIIALVLAVMLRCVLGCLGVCSSQPCSCCDGGVSVKKGGFQPVPGDGDDSLLRVCRSHSGPSEELDDIEFSSDANSDADDSILLVVLKL